MDILQEMLIDAAVVADTSPCFVVRMSEVQARGYCVLATQLERARLDAAIAMALAEDVDKESIYNEQERLIGAAYWRLRDYADSLGLPVALYTPEQELCP